MGTDVNRDRLWEAVSKHNLNGNVFLVEESGWGGYSARPAAWANP